MMPTVYVKQLILHLSDKHCATIIPSHIRVELSQPGYPKNKQVTVMLSLCKVKLLAAAEATKKLLWFHTILWELGFFFHSLHQLSTTSTTLS